MSALQDERKALVCALLAVLCWSTVATAFKLSLAEVSPLQLVTWASVTATLALSLALPFGGRWRALTTRSVREWTWSLGLGTLNPVLYYAVLFAAYDRLPAQEAQSLNYTWAFVLVLLSVPVLGHRLTRWDVLGGLLAYGGVVVIATRGRVLDWEFADPAGVALALASTVLWAGYWLLAARDQRDPLLALFMGFALGTPLLLVWSWLEGALWLSARGYVGAVYVGVMEMALPFTLWLVAMRATRQTARIGMLIFLSPFLSLFFIRWLLQEPILRSTWVGLTVIVLGLLLQRWMNARRPGVTG